MNFELISRKVVALHPSCGLDSQPEWVIFNEFVLTSRPYIRTVTDVKPEWSASRIPKNLLTLTVTFRLLEFAANYFDVASFPDGETKRALQRVINKRLGKADARFEGGSNSDASGNEQRAKKKRKKN